MKCKNCGYTKGDHRAGDNNCPIGKPDRKIGFTFYSKDYHFTPIPATCCKMMRDQFKPFTCGIHESKWTCPDVIIDEHKNKFGIIIHDGSGSVLKIKYCPWCGKKLADKSLWSLRDYQTLAQPG